MPRRPAGEKAKRASEKARIDAYIDCKYRLVLDPVVRAAKDYEAGRIDWDELDGVLHGYTIVAREVWTLTNGSRADLLGLIEREERGEAYCDPTERLTEPRWQRSTGQHYREFREMTLEEAARRFNAFAVQEGRKDRARDTEAWRALVLSHMRTNDVGGFILAALGGARNYASAEELTTWSELAQDIWNNTPMPDRDGLTPMQMIRQRR